MTSPAFGRRRCLEWLGVDAGLESSAEGSREGPGVGNVGVFGECVYVLLNELSEKDDIPG